MLPFIKEVDEEYAPLASEILEDLTLSRREGAILRKRQEAFCARLPAHTVQGAVIKLPSHSNADQRELRVHIDALQRALDKPMHPGCLSLPTKAHRVEKTTPRGHHH